MDSISFPRWSGLTLPSAVSLSSSAFTFCHGQCNALESTEAGLISVSYGISQAPSSFSWNVP